MTRTVLFAIIMMAAAMVLFVAACGEEKETNKDVVQDSYNEESGDGYVCASEQICEFDTDCDQFAQEGEIWFCAVDEEFTCCLRRAGNGNIDSGGVS